MTWKVTVLLSVVCLSLAAVAVAALLRPALVERRAAEVPRAPVAVPAPAAAGAQGWTPDVPEKLQPEHWVVAQGKLQKQMEQDHEGGVEARLIRSDCSEMPCIAFVELGGGQGNLQQKLKVANDYTRRAMAQALPDYGDDLYPYVQGLATRSGKTKAAIAFLPMKRIGNVNGPDPDLLSRVEKRIAASQQ